jgi:predicted acyl esterase
VVHVARDSCGHRLRLAVASAAFPKYDRNLNAGGDNERDTRFLVAHQRILHDAIRRAPTNSRTDSPTAMFFMPHP